MKTQEEISDYNRRCAEFLGIKIDFNVADWSKYDDKSLTEHWNNNNKTWVHTPKGQGLHWYRVKHRGNFYQLFTDFTFQKLKESDIELGGEYNGKYYELKDMQFHSDWSWIMEVVEAIEKLGFYSKISGCASSICHYCWFDEGGDGGDIPTNRTVIGYNSKNNESKKEAVVQAINQFLI